MEEAIGPVDPDREAGIRALAGWANTLSEKDLAGLAVLLTDLEAGKRLLDTPLFKKRLAKQARKRAGRPM